MSFEGQVPAVTRLGNACSYRAELAISSTLDGRAVAGTVQAEWKGDCPPTESGSPVGDTYTGKVRVRVHTTASGTPDGFRFRGVATITGNPEG